MTHPETEHLFGFITAENRLVTNYIDYLARQAAVAIVTDKKWMYSLQGLAKILGVKQVASWAKKVEAANRELVHDGWFPLCVINKLRLPSRSPVCFAMDDLLIAVRNYIKITEQATKNERKVLQSLNALSNELSDYRPKYLDEDLQQLHSEAVRAGQKRTSLDIMRLQCYMMFYPEVTDLLQGVDMD